MTRKETETRYAKLLHDVKTNDYYKVDLTNSVNCYVCSNCGNTIKTKDIQAGVTPAMKSYRQPFQRIINLK